MGRSARGFTLIELSIVLVIIGLIVGGVLVGQDLIKAAQVRAQISQIEKYNTATNTFRGKYGYLPGDIKDPDATQFGFASRGSYAGEGDGNGLIEGNFPNGVGGNSGIHAFEGEEVMFWVDLSKVSLVDGSFTTATPTGSISSTITGSAINQYLPQAKIGSGGGYVYVWSGGWKESASGGFSPGDSTNYFAVTGVTGTSPAVAGYASTSPLMTPVQAYSIDTKVDDGMPQSGNVTAQIASGSNGWAAGGGNTGDCDPGTCGPVVAGDGKATSGAKQGVATTCYDNNNVAGATETYSLGNANMVNCWLSFRFQ